MKNIVNFLDGKKHIIWDWNGTLINDVDFAISTMNQLLSARSMNLIDREYYLKIFEFPVINYYKTLGFNFEKEPFADVCHEFVELYMKGFQNCPLVEGAENILSTVSDMGLTQSVLSASDQVSLDKMVSHFNLGNYFESVCGIEDKLAGSKIEKGHLLVSSSEHTRSEFVLAGDTKHDLEVGTKLGIDTILIGHGHQCSVKLSNIHHTVI